MKKLLCILTLLVIFASSCSAGVQGNPFALFEKTYQANVTLECNGNASAFDVIYQPGSEFENELFQLTITSPEQASGYVFTLDGEEYKLSFSGISIECNEQLAEYPKIVRALLTPCLDDIVSIGSESLDGETYSAVRTADVKYLFLSDGTPFLASGVACGKAVSIKFNSFSLVTGEAK